MESIILFDIDGTLTNNNQVITNDILNFLKQLLDLKKYDIGYVSSSNLDKQIKQLGKENLSLFKWRFSENGLISYRDNKLIHKKNLVREIGDINYSKLVNIILLELSKIDLPLKRGNFIELRNGILNISPIGRSCSLNERQEFYKYDKKHLIRHSLINNIKSKMMEINLGLDLKFSLGGQISIDIFPTGWDKTYCLQFISNEYDKIFFIGDRTNPGENDNEIYHHDLTTSFKVKNYIETIHLIKTRFLTGSI